jgi:hypothetical protein
MNRVLFLFFFEGTGTIRKSFMFEGDGKLIVGHR